MQLPLDYSSFSLPESVAVELLTAVDSCSEQLKPNLYQLVHHGDKLRESVLRRGLILASEDCPPVPLGAVDGVHILQPSTGADFVGIAAFRLDAFQQLGHLAMIDTVAHSVEIDSILAGIRNIFEAELLKMAHPDRPLILDGSYWSILQDINRMFYSRHHTGSETGLWRPFLSHLERFIDKQIFPTMLETGGVLANSKRAVSNSFVKEIAPRLADTLPDRALFTVVLRPGEYTRPTPLIGGTTGRLGIFTSDAPVSWSADKERKVIERFYQEEVKVIYYKPFEWSPAYRLEMPRLLVEKIDQVLAGFKSTLISPDILEPYPQFLVDKLCKQIPAALSAVAEGTTNALRREFEPDLLRKFFGAYRTR